MRYLSAIAELLKWTGEALYKGHEVWDVGEARHNIDIFTKLRHKMNQS